MDDAAYVNPTFMLTGWPNSDGTFTVAASDSLSIAQFQMRRIPFRLDDYRMALEPAGLDLRVGMERLHIAVGATYQEAMQHLFQHWTPESKMPAALGVPTRELAP